MLLLLSLLAFAAALEPTPSDLNVPAMNTEACYGMLYGCMGEGFVEAVSPTLDAWTDVFIGKTELELAGCYMRYDGCVRNTDCMLDAIAEFKQKEGLEVCAEGGKWWSGLSEEDKFKMKVAKMMKLVSDGDALRAMTGAFCSADHGWRMGKCFKKALGLGWGLEGKRFLHMQFRKKECKKSLPRECRQIMKEKTQRTCACVDALESRVDDIKNFVTDKCGADTFPAGFDVKRIHAYMKTKKCTAKKEKACWKKVKRCAKDKASPGMKMWEKIPDVKKAGMIIEMMPKIFPAAAACFEAAPSCVQDLDCAMRAGWKFMAKLPDCQSSLVRWAAMPQDKRKEKKMKKFLSLIFDEEWGPKMAGAICGSADEASTLRTCLKAAFDISLPTGGTVGDKMAEWISGGRAAKEECKAGLPQKCQDLMAAKKADKCACTQAAIADLDGLKKMIDRKCLAGTIPDAALIDNVFKLKADKTCPALS